MKETFYIKQVHCDSLQPNKTVLWQNKAIVKKKGDVTHMDENYMDENYMDENELFEFMVALVSISEDDGSSPERQLQL